MTNPYRKDSKLFDIFKLMSSGAYYSLGVITDVAYRRLSHASDHLLYRRRVASALRTIRRLPHVSIFYVKSRKMYSLVKKVVAPDSRLSDDRS